MRVQNCNSPRFSQQPAPQTTENKPTIESKELFSRRELGQQVTVRVKNSLNQLKLAIQAAVFKK